MGEAGLPWSDQPVRTMTGSAAEFRRALRQAFGPAAVEFGAGVRLMVDGVCLRFDIAAEAPLRLGSLALERLQVRVSVESGDFEAARRLLARVDRATQRGGG
ncbi:MAG: hypothetical protein FIB06_11770 [Betaproteobacteria bacterium]|nr:hypothetical protein [Betaproteobacteria bacterium]